MSLVARASWLLVATFAISLAYELYRTTANAGTSRCDTVRFLLQGIPFYVVAFAMGLLFTVGALLVSALLGSR